MLRQTRGGVSGGLTTRRRRRKRQLRDFASRASFGPKMYIVPLSSVSPRCVAVRPFRISRIFSESAGCRAAISKTNSCADGSPSRLARGLPTSQPHRRPSCNPQVGNRAARGCTRIRLTAPAEKARALFQSCSQVRRPRPQTEGLWPLLLPQGARSWIAKHCRNAQATATDKALHTVILERCWRDIGASLQEPCGGERCSSYVCVSRRHANASANCDRPGSCRPESARSKRRFARFGQHCPPNASGLLQNRSQA